MNIEKLKEMLPVPASPREIPRPGDWRMFESGFGLLPDDYKIYIETYGTGQIDWFLSIFNPFAANAFINLKVQADVFAADIADAANDFKLYESLVCYPAPGGLLPLGQTDGGCYLTWRTCGHPNEWKIAIMRSRSPDLECFEMGFLPFLIGYLSRNIRPSFLPAPSAGDVIEFVNRMGG